MKERKNEREIDIERKENTSNLAISFPVNTHLKVSGGRRRPISVLYVPHGRVIANNRPKSQHSLGTLLSR